MKRVYIAAVLITSCFALCIYFCYSQNKKYDELNSEFETAIKFTETSNYEKMEKQADKILKLWEKYHASFSILITHSHFDDLDEYIHLLKVSAKEKSIGEYEENCNLAMYELKHLKKSQKPKPENIF